MTGLYALLLTAAAVAATPDPATTLSRFSAGTLPATEPVLAAISALGDRGASDDLPLLRSLATEESGLVALAALAATDTIEGRMVADRRSAFSEALPVAAELAQAARQLRGPLGPAEAEAVAYARAVLGATEAPATLDTVAPDKAAALVADGDRAEREARPRDALALYAQAAASGSAAATERISAFGVDHELLLLGMTTASGPAPAAVLEPLAIEALARTGSDRTVRVLVERARDPRPLVRIVALDALADMMKRRRLPWGRGAPAPAPRGAGAPGRPPAAR